MAHQDHEPLDASGIEPAVAWDAPKRRRRTGWVTGLAIAVGFGGLAALALTEGLVAGSGAAVRLDPGTDEMGLAVRVGGGLILPPVVAIVFAAIALIGLVTLLGRERSAARAVGALGIALVALGGFAALNLVPVASDQVTRAWGDGIGHTVSSTSALTPWTEYDVGPGDPATFAFPIRNDGPLPVTILGYADEPFINGTRTVELGFRVVGLGSLPSSEADRTDGRPPQMDAAVVAWPVRLAPGDRLILVAVGRGGPCAAGTPAASAESTTLLSHVRLVYRIASWTRVTEMALPTVVMVPTNVASCPAKVGP